MLLTMAEEKAGSSLATNMRGMAQSLGEPVAAVTYVGTEPNSDSITNLADELVKEGVTKLYVVRHRLLDSYAPEAFGEALAQLIDALRPTGVLATSTDRDTEILAHTAARARLPLATNCLAITSGESWRLTRMRGGGMVLEDAELTAPIKLATVAPGAATVADAPAVDECVVQEFTPELADELRRTQVIERATSGAEVTLATAPVVVAGGRGVGSAEGYAVLEELADLLGGVVGCSRVATNNGWRPHSDQVGLTGTKVSPRLYIACGISGATQHWVGCMDSQTILAINTDADAPMVRRATYAVIGDIHQIVPAIIAELKSQASYLTGN